ncbi:SET domain-containing protein-lysine N-methyltransferase [Winogradskyella litoriviva]|uniref:SET domain-containing protein-lysine N-methyltransferase n=1 Tax=Winogradskyella litoriviva TaxID=1220182 RepID=A0ABX2E6H4_9FLAO|nr:SET domain-containing protein-lysine N-methyltransferase [Winogradskyella litoriviva]
MSLNIIEAPESDYLYTETSQIKNAGTGLFTAIDIFEEEIVALFKGEIINNQEAEKRALLNEDRYFVNLLDGSIMDSMHTDCFAKYANDAEGLMESSFKNNAIITLDDDNNVCIKAIRNIDAGEEIFCSYGKPYWKKHAN